jgi:hypothetical protein
MAKLRSSSIITKIVELVTTTKEITRDLQKHSDITVELHSRMAGQAGKKWRQQKNYKVHSKKNI